MADNQKHFSQKETEPSSAKSTPESTGGLWFFRGALLIAIAIPLLPFLTKGYSGLAFCNRNLSGLILMLVIFPTFIALLVTFLFRSNAGQRFSSALAITWAIMVIPIAMLFGSMSQGGSASPLPGLILISQLFPFAAGIGLLTQAKPEAGTRGRPASGGVAAAVALGIVVLVILLPHTLRSGGMRAGDSARMGVMRLLIKCAYEYQTSHPKEGWPLSLKQIGPGGEDCIDSVLLEATTPNGKPKDGYLFTYTAGEPNPEGVAETFTITGMPVNCGCGGVRTYYADESGVVRFTNDQRNNCPAATATSPPFS